MHNILLHVLFRYINLVTVNNVTKKSYLIPGNPYFMRLLVVRRAPAFVLQ